MALRIALVDDFQEIIDIGLFDLRMVEVAMVIGIGGAEVSLAFPWHHEEHPAVVQASIHIRWLWYRQSRTIDNQVNPFRWPQCWGLIFGLIQRLELVRPRSGRIDHEFGMNVENTAIQKILNL